MAAAQVKATIVLLEFPVGPSITMSGLLFLVGYILALIAIENRFTSITWRDSKWMWLPSASALIFGAFLVGQIFSGYILHPAGGWMMLAFGIKLFVDVMKKYG